MITQSHKMMNNKHAGELSLADTIWLLAEDSLRLQPLGIARVSRNTDQHIEIACGLSGIHKPVFSNRIDLKAGYEYYDEGTHNKYYTTKLTGLCKLAERVSRTIAKTSGELINLQKQLNEIDNEIIKEKA